MLERRVWSGLSPVQKQELWRGLLLLSEDNPPASADPDMARSLVDDSGSLYGVSPGHFIGPTPRTPRIYTVAPEDLSRREYMRPQKGLFPGPGAGPKPVWPAKGTFAGPGAGPKPVWPAKGTFAGPDAGPKPVWPAKGTFPWPDARPSPSGPRKARLRGQIPAQHRSFLPLGCGRCGCGQFSLYLWKYCLFH